MLFEDDGAVFGSDPEPRLAHPFRVVAFPFALLLRPDDAFRLTAERTNALSACSSIASPS